MKNAVYLTIPFQQWHIAKEGKYPLERQVPALTVQTWKNMLSLNNVA
jgi:hypothetical protein